MIDGNNSELSNVCQIEITTKCNMNCFYCPIELMPHRDMSWHNFTNIIDQYPPNTKVILQGPIVTNFIEKNFK